MQVNYTPAYKELYREAQLSLIEKMMRNDVWAPTWLPIIEMDPYKGYLEAGKEWRDPVREKNIMYSGHLLQMIGLYECYTRTTVSTNPIAWCLNYPARTDSKTPMTITHLQNLSMISLWIVIT